MSHIKHAVEQNVAVNQDGVFFATPERNLLTMGFFSPTKRDSRGRKEKVIESEVEIDGKKTTVSVTILPSAKYGLPTTADLDKYMALLMIANEAGGSEPIPNPLWFRGRQLLRYLRLKDCGNNYKSINDWMYRMFTTSIHSRSYIYHARRAIWISDTVHVFERVVCAGQPLPSDLPGEREGEKSEHYIVWLPEWHRDNLSASYSVRIAYDAYVDLKSPLAKTLLTICAARATSQHQVVELDYEQLCQLADLRRLKYKSLIEKQLASAVEELIKTGCITDWELSQTQRLFKLVFHLGTRIQLPRLSQPDRALLEPPRSETPQPDMDPLVHVLVARFGVARHRAEQLVRDRPQSVQRQINWFGERNVQPRNLAGWIVSAIEQDYPAPKLREEPPPDKQPRSLNIQTASADPEKSDPHRLCVLCKDFYGFRYVLDKEGSTVVRRCSHVPEVEKRFKTPENLSP